jgi:hypothetical protein
MASLARLSSSGYPSAAPLAQDSPRPTADCCKAASLQMQSEVVRYERPTIDGTVVYDRCGNVRAISGIVVGTIAPRLETREFAS